ncbi:MAG: hypothetical protein ACOCXQ_02145 [Patescibacteria group bacterium]
MAHKQFGKDLLSAVKQVLIRFILLILYPYKTMRSIAREQDDLQIGVIFFIIFIYYLFIPALKPEITSPVIQLSLVLFNLVMTVIFVYFFGRMLNGETSIRPLLFLFSYSLLPTIIWFYTTSFLFYFLPPPRTLSILGKSFSIIFITFSMSILAWKVILWYLAVRFGTRLKFFGIVFLTLLYLAAVVPYAFYLYQFGFFRIPFL